MKFYLLLFWDLLLRFAEWINGEEKSGHERMKIPRLARSAQSVWETLNERFLNISTTDRSRWNGTAGWWRGPAIEKARHQDNRAYATPDYYYIYKIIRHLNPGEQDVFYDIGSGKGRILCVMSRRKVNKCVGIEILDDLVLIARANAQVVRGRRSPIEIKCEDAAEADMTDGTIFFLFNPFGPDTLKDVLDNIGRSLTRNPRSLKIVYYNSLYYKVVESYSWLRPYYWFRTFPGLKVMFYETY